MDHPTVFRPSWVELSLFTIVGFLLLGIGGVLGLWYCDFRHEARDQQLTAALALGKACVETLGEVVPGAIVLARMQPRAVAVSPAVRDSLRERRWVTP
jgi:hypothetical protein